MKNKLYRTAKVKVARYGFQVGDIVDVEWYFTDNSGVDWYLCRKDNGKQVAYPAIHLEDFCL